jgi:hypothetical protein
MHREVTAPDPGDCPICGMALEDTGPVSPAAMLPDRAASAAEGVAYAALHVSPEATSLLRFSVAQVRRNALPGEIYAPAVTEAGGEIIAQLYRDEFASLAPGERAELIPSLPPGAPIQIRRDGTPPVTPATQAAIARVGFRVEPGAAALPPGQIGWVRLGYKTRATLVVLSAAIIDSPDGPSVFVVSAGGGGLRRRSVEIGKQYAGLTAIVSGLRDKELVVMANTAAFDAERRQAAAP